jgi:hypothetical protein
MSSKKLRQKGPKDLAPDGPELKGVDPIASKTPGKDTDTEPDEFIGHDADTDQPVDRQIMNDAVLRGEDYAANKLPEEDEDKAEE